MIVDFFEVTGGRILPLPINNRQSSILPVGRDSRLGAKIRRAAHFLRIGRGDVPWWITNGIF
jgi:hypothetical protein